MVHVLTVQCFNSIKGREHFEWALTAHLCLCASLASNMAAKWVVMYSVNTRFRPTPLKQPLPVAVKRCHAHRHTWPKSPEHTLLNQQLGRLTTTRFLVFLLFLLFTLPPFLARVCACLYTTLFYNSLTCLQETKFHIAYNARASAHALNTAHTHYKQLKSCLCKHLRSVQSCPVKNTSLFLCSGEGCVQEAVHAVSPW
jgi:hypothetical protein